MIESRNAIVRYKTSCVTRNDLLIVIHKSVQCIDTYSSTSVCGLLKLSRDWGFSLRIFEASISFDLCEESFDLHFAFNINFLLCCYVFEYHVCCMLQTVDVYVRRIDSR